MSQGSMISCKLCKLSLNQSIILGIMSIICGITLLWYFLRKYKILNLFCLKSSNVIKVDEKDDNIISDDLIL
ncbi:hypothetical protein HZS_8031 [Henneguya salminicola]|nr:hypothetical protein HZS_8031 [Henneguya salminicola]